MENKKVRVLLIGAAFSADLHMEGYKRCTDISRIAAICDKDLLRVDSLAQRYGISEYERYDDYEEAIDKTDCDLVDICLPNFLHKEVAIKAFEKGRHVISEKPLATTLKDAELMVKAAIKAGRKLYYAEDWLFAPALCKARELIAEGAIGKPLYIRARECHSGSHSPFTQTIKYCGGGSMVHLGVHPVSFVLALKDCPWTELTAMTSGGLAENLRHTGMEGEDWAACMMRFEDGTFAMLEANYVTMGGMEDAVDIYGTEGCLHIDLTFSSPISAYSVPGFKYTVEKAEVTTGWSKPAVDEKFNLGYIDEIRHFMTACLNDQDAKTGLRGIDGYETLKVIDLIYKSAKKGIRIKNDDK